MNVLSTDRIGSYYALAFQSIKNLSEGEIKLVLQALKIHIPNPIRL